MAATVHATPPRDQRASEAEAGRAGFVDAADGLGEILLHDPREELLGVFGKNRFPHFPGCRDDGADGVLFRVGVDADDGRIAHEAPFTACGKRPLFL